MKREFDVEHEVNKAVIGWIHPTDFPQFVNAVHHVPLREEREQIMAIVEQAMRLKIVHANGVYGYTANRRKI